MKAPQGLSAGEQLLICGLLAALPAAVVGALALLEREGKADVALLPFERQATLDQALDGRPADLTLDDGCYDTTLPITPARPAVLDAGGYLVGVVEREDGTLQLFEQVSSDWTDGVPGLRTRLQEYAHESWELEPGERGPVVILSGAIDYAYWAQQTDVGESRLVVDCLGAVDVWDLSLDLDEGTVTPHYPIDVDA